MISLFFLSASRCARGTQVADLLQGLDHRLGIDAREPITCVWLAPAATSR